MNNKIDTDEEKDTNSTNYHELMTKSSISREQSLFEAARELRDPIQRNAFLREACGEDSALRIRVENLLSASEQADKFFAGCAPALRTISETHQKTETRSTNLANRPTPLAEEKL